jgi:hypothetical protein
MTFPQSSASSQPPRFSPTSQTSQQLSLFSLQDSQSLYDCPVNPAYEISLSALTDWKQRIYRFQQQVRDTPLPHQGSLFSGSEISYRFSETTLDPAIHSIHYGIDPFNLPRQNINFWRWKVTDQGEPSLYFVIDYQLPVLLYVGETVKSNQRWQGEHDCKRYLSHYRQAHYHHQLDTQIGIAFLRGMPIKTRARQRLELDYIERWRSPFNKENWVIWGTPFVTKQDPP